MKRADKFVIPPNWKVLCKDLGVDLQVALGYADLPLALFEQKKVQLSPAQYFQLWYGINKASQVQGVEFALKLAEVMSLESFDVPIFAAICSPNLNSALKRLQEYKPLIGPMELNLTITDIRTELNISCYGYTGALPNCVNLSELVFFTQLTRLATRQSIKPIKVVLPELPQNLAAYTDYFGCDITLGNETTLVFSNEDAQIPFLTDNQTMLNVFDQEIRKNLDAMTKNQATSSAVYTHLLELLPQGKSSIETLASRMAMSKRTLQRKLSAEGSSYQLILHKVREELAHYYLKETELPIGEVSFLLGFQESNSFIRAYTSWTGVSPGQVRN
ncbi:AraC family transcriptional regulator [Vibrio sp. Of7-15]|uniref:AraC family transcriptional regulator n=1 Tax=Vibrio sp. Of7-15 TaxID=2724879 RepID=UPI001EF35515|nr:AraC family transcriptional regulator [Vibrio sp. Of7-15]MCG7497827.1 AraC family transcriptional regulator [Vibrio sp. Of7-15]